ncbi:MAG TPA: alkaline phosphatase family protein [Candidatus Acidoferrum sp.]|nr:alkaline phosphatase family protein [Candidatus Acidoferrum sp.]
MKSKRFSGLAKIWVSVALLTCGAAFTSSGQQPDNGKTPVLAPGKHFERVLIIVLENQDYSSAISNPFLAKLAGKGTSFTNFKNLYHPSYPNYLAMIAGSSFGMHSDRQINLPDDPQHRTIADLLDWKNYAENYPTNVQPYLEADEGKYARKHVPFLSFVKIQKESYRNVVPVDTKNPHNAFVTAIEMFREDPKKFPLPRYMFYTPNLDDDGHDPFYYSSKGLQKASRWLETFFRTWFPWDHKEMNGTLVIVTFDESEGDEKNERIYTVFLGDMVKNQTVDKEYNHYSVLKTIEDNFGLPPLNSGDANAAPITEAWK